MEERSRVEGHWYLQYEAEKMGTLEAKGEWEMLFVCLRWSQQAGKSCYVEVEDFVEEVEDLRLYLPVQAEA